MMPLDCRARALHVLCLISPADKAAAAQALYLEAQNGLSLDTEARLQRPEGVPGRPERPRLLSALQVPNRSPFTLEGRAALIHAIAHIEFNAINLALDAVWRFAGMPREFYLDWLRVAAEEAQHFSLLHDHLQSLGHRYGDFDAHDGLWTMAERTADDVLARMALVPRTLEARGLDATPPLQAKLARAGDARAVAILDIILREEIGHVEIGNRWYRHCCRLRGLDPVAIYPGLVQHYQAPRLRPPFNLSARGAAGFSEEELAYLQADFSNDRTGAPDAAQAVNGTAS
ncbi:ferritin-like domain-containing protein [Kinneretia aquatilis]|uniref:ferritin-like domain-containing protein n=1 Tax=Kinneretia aquatilis TaxID=2070761 RepID=UPI001A9CDEA3